MSLTSINLVRAETFLIDGIEYGALEDSVTGNLNLLIDGFLINALSPAHMIDLLEDAGYKTIRHIT